MQTKRSGSTHCRVRPTFAVASTPGLGMVQIVEHHDDDGDAATRPVESCSPPQSVAAEEHKARGNACFARGEWEDAARHYTLALEAAPASTPEERKLDEDTIVERVRRRDRAVYLSNRAACRVKLGSHTQAAEDCTAAIAEDDTFVKAYLRRSAARERLDDLEGALADAERAAELEPGSHTQASASAEAAAAGGGKEGGDESRDDGEAEELRELHPGQLRGSPRTTSRRRRTTPPEVTTSSSCRTPRPNRQT